ncbi:cytochrome c [Microvirga pudoricolor]|uniref:cytochrome c n=1 Tax=Microvirga pudoricolor TaxID=2778729 RepID=UPI001951E476|nr:cytochrome c [Microvirga pudoricolor]MBM6594497.1 c-type cytochrome [Microvirga pudoricolor]
MRRAFLVLLVLVLLGAAGFWALTSPGTYDLVRGQNLALTANRAPDLANGRELFYAGGCTSCHAVPGQDDKTRLGGGYALKSPFGTFHVPNISPNKSDGIGAWTPAQFVRAMREGVTPDGQHLYPAFPYTSYQRMKPDDVADMFAFIMTLPAVEGRAKPHELPFPYNIRRGVGLWKLAFLNGKVFESDPAKSASLNRGDYLTNGPGHCAECHSPRNLAGAIVADRRFSGGPDPEGRGTVPNITPDASGIGGWTVDDLTNLLKTGETPNYDTVGGPMGDVVRNTAQLTDEDRAAMAEYLLSLPKRPAYKAP